MYSFVDRLARFFALSGGAVLSSLIILTCLSILGRSINSILNSDALQNSVPEFANLMLKTGVGPINGDFELVEAGMAFAIFAFLPLCQLRGAHASVDILVSSFSPTSRRWLQMVIELVFAAVIILIAYQLFLGMESKRNSGQTSFLLAFPVWWGYALSLSAAIVAALVSVYVAAIRVLEAITGERILPTEMEANH